MTADTDPDGHRDSWRDAAACLEHPAEWFTGPHEPGHTRRALDVCAACPVKQPCLDAALQIEVSADLGIWGGTTPTTRRHLRREQARDRLFRHTKRRLLPKLAPEQTATVTTDELQLVEDERGDFIDRSGRVIVFAIYGDPPYMLIIDGQPRARTTTVQDAAGLAARFLAKEDRSAEVGADQPMPRDFPRRRA